MSTFTHTLKNLLAKIKTKLVAFKAAMPRLFMATKYTGVVFGGLFALYLLFYLLVLAGAFGKLPSRKNLQHIQNPLASEVYSADGALLGKYYIENRSRVKFEDIPSFLIKGLVATEDARFYEHAGVDRRSMMRVVVKSILLQDKSAGGGSTLSQQLAKNLFPRKRFSFLTMPVAKLKEVLIAKRLERENSKEEILALYLNTVSFGESAYGLGTASLRFFGSKPSNLRIEEAATLVGLLKATNYYNPRLHPERAIERRNVVLGQMVKYNFMTANLADSLQQLPLTLDYKRYTTNDGLASYFRAHLKGELKTWLKANPKPDGTTYNLFTDGLKISTTIDSRMQAHAEKAMRDHMAALQKTFYKHWKGRTPWGKDNSSTGRAVKRSDRYRALRAAGADQATIDQVFSKSVRMKLFSWKGEIDTTLSPMDSVIYYQYFLNAGFLAAEPQTGEVRAWVGGIDHRYFQYDHVLAKRQVGSTFKPIVYAAALEEGRDPCEWVSNERQVYEDYKNWSPGNSDGKYEGFYSMQGGLMNSVNTIAVKLMMETGVENVITLAREMGIENTLPNEPSIALGAADLSLQEMVRAYAVFANGGYEVTPRYLSKIETLDGEVLFEAEKFKQGDRILDEHTSEMMTRMLQSAADSGTGAALRYRYGLRGAIAGKTGTTQSHTDGWFMGYTPKLVAGAWVGGEDRKVRFRSLSLGQGSKTALPIWAKFMAAVYADPVLKGHARAQFPPVSQETLVSMDCPTFTLIPEDSIPTLIEEWWIEFERKRQERIEDRRERRENRPKQQKPTKNRKKKKGKFIETLKDIFGDS